MKSKFQLKKKHAFIIFTWLYEKKYLFKKLYKKIIIKK